MPSPSTLLQSLAVAMALAAPALTEETYTLPSGDTVSPLDSFKECSVCPEVVVMPLGEFTMGADLEETRRLAELQEKLSSQLRPYGLDEGPKHQVIMDMPFAIGRSEVTRSEWMACVRARACGHTPGVTVPSRFGTVIVDKPTAPVIDVSYQDAQQYLAWLNRLSGTDAYRLPSEVEWEYAARGGTKTTYPQGDVVTQSQANFAEFHSVDGRRVPVPGQRMAPMTAEALESDHPWGLAHIVGNLREITLNCYEDSHLSLPSQSAYFAVHQDVDTCLRVLKDGSYSGIPEHSRPAARMSTSEDKRRTWIGFRVVRELD